MSETTRVLCEQRCRQNFFIAAAIWEPVKNIGLAHLLSNIGYLKKK